MADQEAAQPVVAQPVVAQPVVATPALRTSVPMLLLYGMLGFSAGLPFVMFSTMLSLWLKDAHVSLAIIGFFGWVQLLPTFKFLWAPLLDRYAVPGLSGFWGKRRSWIMLSQLGIALSLLAMTLSLSHINLPLMALLATLLAFWTTSLEIAADGWRIALAPEKEQQGPIAAANIWGYRTAMIGAASGALLLSDTPQWSWTAAYAMVTLVAFAPLPILALLPREPGHSASRATALAKGAVAAGLILTGVAVAFAAIGWLLLRLFASLNINADSNITPWVLGICMIPFLIMAMTIPHIRRLGPDAPLLNSAALGAYAHFFRKWGWTALVLMAFVSVYRMGDVLTLNYAKLLQLSAGYSKTDLAFADLTTALPASIWGAVCAGWMVTRWSIGRALAVGAIVAAIGNFAYVWLAQQPAGWGVLYATTAADQFGNGMAGTIFVVYLSLLCDQRFTASHYAFLSGFTFLLPRLLSGQAGQIIDRLNKAGERGYDLFFLTAGLLTLAALFFLPFVARPKPQDAQARDG